MSTRPNILLAAAALTGLAAVALGAFGAHALRGTLDAYSKDVWDTATLYALVHTAIAAAIGLAPGERRPALAGWLFLAGCVVFSGSLYALALTGIGVLGAITPAGGVSFLSGWALLAISALKRG